MVSQAKADILILITLIHYVLRSQRFWIVSTQPLYEFSVTRLTTAFSKKLSHLKAATYLHFGYYNFGRTHKTIRCPPAMEAKLTDHVWTIAELIA
jgi:hypothetical protein